jgi:fumarate reductase subunit D
MRRNDHRAHRHPAWWAFLVHRVSGLALALFLPLHFLGAGQALRGPPPRWRAFCAADAPLVKLAEWGLVLLLALHLTGGVRLLLIEFGPGVRPAQELDRRRHLGVALATGWPLRWRCCPDPVSHPSQLQETRP